jgi:hypothetical protein
MVATVLEERDADLAWDVAAHLEELVIEDPETAEIELMMYLSTSGGWTGAARRHGVDAVAILAWVEEDLDPDAAELARALAGFVGHPDAEPPSLDTALDLLGTEAMVGLVALAAGLTATAGGDAASLRQWDAGWPEFVCAGRSSGTTTAWENTSGSWRTSSSNGCAPGACTVSSATPGTASTRSWARCGGRGETRPSCRRGTRRRPRSWRSGMRSTPVGWVS